MTELFSAVFVFLLAADGAGCFFFAVPSPLGDERERRRGSVLETGLHWPAKGLL